MLAEIDEVGESKLVLKSKRSNVPSQGRSDEADSIGVGSLS